MDAHGVYVFYGADHHDVICQVAHGFGEEFAVLRFADRRDRRSEEFDVEFVEDASLVELDSQVEGGLASQGGEQGIGALAAEYLGDSLGRQRLDVGCVRNLWVRHYRGRVGVYEDYAVTFVAQGSAGLGTRIVELCGLPDHDRTRADDQDARDVVAARHARPARSLRYCSQTLRTGGPSPSGLG